MPSARSPSGSASAAASGSSARGMVRTASTRGLTGGSSIHKGGGGGEGTPVSTSAPPYRQSRSVGLSWAWLGVVDQASLPREDAGNREVTMRAPSRLVAPLLFVAAITVFAGCGPQERACMTCGGQDGGSNFGLLTIEPS